MLTKLPGFDAWIIVADVESVWAASPQPYSTAGWIVCVRMRDGKCLTHSVASEEEAAERRDRIAKAINDALAEEHARHMNRATAYESPAPHGEEPMFAGPFWKR